MEDVLEVYCRPFDPANPVVCMDEASKQLIGEVRDRLPMRAGQIEKYDSEYRRLGTANIFMAVEPLAGKRTTQITDRRTKLDWARFIRHLLEHVYPDAEKIVLVMDNLNTHSGGSLYEAFDAETARKLLARLEIHYTPKHGSWLNMAETELSVLCRQCLDRRIGSKQKMTTEVAAWEHDRNDRDVTIKWHFKTEDARVKLRRLYPSIQD